MSRAASTVPDEAALLCEGCGYILTGLPPDSRCPECAKPIEESSPQLRELPDWERDNHSRWHGFWTTTASALFRPTRFFRTLATRSRSSESKSFARWHYGTASVLLSLAAVTQAHWVLGMWPSPQTRSSLTDVFIGFMRLHFLMFWVVGCLACYLFLTGVVGLAARLTAWEAAYRGLRLPLHVVQRGLDYHSAHYLPVAFLAALTVVGYQVLLHVNVLTELVATRYIYLLCAEVVLGAFYLFVTYWKGMRNVLFANG